MKEVIDANPHTVERARAAMLSLGITPITNPIRGGTDGSRLSFMGLPCPNLGTGMGNVHSGFEYASIDEMISAQNLIIEIARGAK